MNENDLPKRHPREDVLQTAGIDLQGVLLDWKQRHGLSWLEAISLMATMNARWLSYPTLDERKRRRRWANPQSSATKT